jgi:hypothetical protein
MYFALQRPMPVTSFCFWRCVKCGGKLTWYILLKRV